MRGMIPQVSHEKLLAHLRTLEGERHPFFSPEHLARTQAYVEEEFRNAGLSVRLHEFSYLGQTFMNVVAHPPGLLEHQPRLLVGAHLDTVPGTPGADDNASGVAVLLETARVVTAHRPEAPVEFIGFNLEELNMVGSYHYTAALAHRRVPVLGMFSLEMVGFTESRGLQHYPPLLKHFYPRVGNFIGLVANRRSQPLLQTAVQAMRAVPALPVETVVLPANGWLAPESRLSDHAPFWDAGYQALLITDTAFLRNPHYHQSTDTVDTLDLGFLERVCQGVVAAVAALTSRPPADDAAGSVR